MKGRIQSSFTFLNKILNKGHERSTKAKKNILASIFIRGLSISISLIVVPLTINYLNPSRYGIWLTISSIIGWFSFFNVGLTQGLRNRFAEAKAKGNDELAQSYVSTTYAILAIIFFSVWLIFLAVNHFLDWSSILNISTDMKSEVSTLAIIVFTYFCLQFVLNIITTVLLANQEPAKSSLIDVLGQVVSLLFIFILVKTTEGSLIRLGIALCLSPLLVLVVANIFFFSGPYRKYRPVFSSIKFSNAKDLFNLGVVFFIIQVAGLIQFETANIIIARNFSTADVTSYNIVFKYFNILNMGFTIFLSPFWSASTEAFVKNDIQWIKNAIKKYNQLNLLLVFGGLIMLIFSQKVYSLWLGEGKVNISFYLSLSGFLYFSLLMFGSKYVYFLNGINALRIQFLACTISPLIYVGASLVFIHICNMGVYSLFIASIIANFNGYILSPLQYHYIINKNKQGIWRK
jgi:O-antigen/teichoic acid export membrane protein